MPQDVDAFLIRQLDVLDARGRRYLHATAARTALLRVASVLPLALLAAATACLVWNLVQPIPVAWTVSIFVTLVLIVALVAYLAERPGHAIDRAAALAVFDGQLGLKDRLHTANEFLGLSQRDGFRDAALQETLSSVGLALAHSLTVARDPSLADMLRRRWPTAATAAMMLVLAGIISHSGGSGDGHTIADAARDAWRGVRLASAREASNSTAKSRDGSRRGASGSGAGGSNGAQGSDAGADGESGSNPSGTEDAPGAGFDANSADNTASTSSEAGSGAGLGKAEAGSASPGKGSRDSASQTAAAEIASGEAASSGASSTAAATHPRPGDAAASAAPGQQGLATPPAPRRTSPQSGEGMPQGRQSRSQKGDGGSSQPGQGNGQGSDGQRSGGEEALKKSRGISGLLLAVPMQDRLIGTANPGPVESVTRRSQPGRSPAGVGEVGDRGIAGGTVGRIPHRATTAQERLLLERYFRRGPAAGGKPR